jgi:hypothetical protein
MKTIAHWTPAAFCAFISLIAVFAWVRSSDTGWWQPVFFAFLPMCFFFVGAVTFAMHRELRELRKRLADLEQKKSS